VFYPSCLYPRGLHFLSKTTWSRLIATKYETTRFSWAFTLPISRIWSGSGSSSLLVVPSYVYHFKPIKEIVVLGELFAASSVMIGRSLCHGGPRKARSILAYVAFYRIDELSSIPVGMGCHCPEWLSHVEHLHSCLPLSVKVVYYRKNPNWKFILPFILLSVPWAVGIHTVTAFLYNGLLLVLSGMHRF